MPDFSTFIPETYHSISPRDVEILFDARREELFTGMMRLHRSPGENLVVIFLDGIQQKLYRCLENTTEQIPRQRWFDTLDHTPVSVGFLRLPVEVMRFTRMVYEAPVVRVEKSLFSSQGLQEAVGKWTAANDPGIIQVHGEKIDRFYLVAGHASPVVEALVFVNGEVRSSMEDANFPKNLPQADYHIVRYVSNGEHEVWREYGLRLAFNALTRMLLSRFGELVGRVLTERLCQQLSLDARQQGWNIAITSNGAINRHYFDSLESAMKAYGEVLRRFRQEASPAIGARMMDGISREVLMKLDPYRRDLLTQYIYSQYGVGGAAGVVWR